MFLNIFQTDLSFARPSKTEEHKSTLEANLGQWSYFERLSEALEIFMTPCKDRA
jgi:hypothetical protein